MNNAQLDTAISQPRFSRYYAACGNSKRKALKLYRANILLSQKMYALVGLFEVILRNSIDTYFIALNGNHWLENAVQPGGYLYISDGCEESFLVVREALERLGAAYTHDALITKLSFGFWTYRFAKKQYAAAGSTLLDIFPNRPFGIKQKVVFQNLVRINDLRNRIAHYEPVCFDKSTGAISTIVALNRYELIREMLFWLGCNVKNILYGVDGVFQATKVINAI